MMPTVIEASAPEQFGARFAKHAQLLNRMNALHLKLKWTSDFDIQTLNRCCDRMEAHYCGLSISSNTLQKELIQNSAFADYLWELQQHFPVPLHEKDGTNFRLEPSSHSMYHYPPAASDQQPNAVPLSQLQHLIKACWEHERDITQFQVGDVMTVLQDGLLPEDRMLPYLLNFAPMHLEAEQQSVVLENLKFLHDCPLLLDEAQRAFLQNPMISTRNLFYTEAFAEVWTLLDTCPTLVQIMELFHHYDINERLDLQAYHTIASNAQEYHRLLRRLLERIGGEDMEELVEYWFRDRCPLQELKTMERALVQTHELDVAAIVESYASYINFLYKNQFRTLSLVGMSDCQENLVVYAILHQKKHFIRLLDDHADLFHLLPSNSLLFESSIYEVHLNLNELTAKNLKALRWMTLNRHHKIQLTEGRRYTFQELTALYHAPEHYAMLYNRLSLERQDDRLLILKQLTRRNALPDKITAEELSELARLLDCKPPSIWREKDFGHIRDLKVPDVIQLLLCLPKILHLLPTMENRTDAMLALRLAASAESYTSMTALKENLLHSDSAWQELAQRMQLSQNFITENQQHIFQFLIRNGAAIALEYRQCLDDKRSDAFLRVVKAELMGKLREVKYFPGDLQKELSIPITEKMESLWKENSSFVDGHVEIRECDDFFSTMLLGIQPQRTCLSYIDGQYRHCLFAGFDSNKKVLYAERDGRIVGRAYLRLTKGRMTQSNLNEKMQQFTFVDLENIEASRPQAPTNRELVTVFLECPYFSGVAPDMKCQIQKQMIKLAEQKARAMGALLVLSGGYENVPAENFVWTKFDLYISRTKAGEQYLDSLNGAATVSSEGKFCSGSFRVSQDYFQDAARSA